MIFIRCVVIFAVIRGVLISNTLEFFSNYQNSLVLGAPTLTPFILQDKFV